MWEGARARLTTVGSGRSAPSHQTCYWQKQAHRGYKVRLRKEEGTIERFHLHRGPQAVAQRPHPAEYLLL